MRGHGPARSARDAGGARPLSSTPACELVRTLSADGNLVYRALVGTPLVAEAARRHGTAPTATAALGRSLMGAVLLASGADAEQSFQIQVRGDGPLRGVFAMSDGLGRARGYVGNPAAHLPPRAGKLDVGGVVGSGLLSVVRSHPSWREPFTGIVPLQSGEVAEDIAHYLVESEQVPSALALGVFVEADGSVGAAGGFLVQALPGASETALARLEDTISGLESPSTLVAQGLSADDIVDRLCAGEAHGGRVRSQPRFACSCDDARVKRAVVLLGREETRRIQAEREPLEVRCEFCGERYVLSPDEVGQLLPDA